MNRILMCSVITLLLSTGCAGTCTIMCDYPNTCTYLDLCYAILARALLVVLFVIIYAAQWVDMRVLISELGGGAF